MYPFPRELVEHIFAYLDKSSLSSCSTVCSSWRHPARFHLFRTIFVVAGDVTGTHDLPAFRSFLEAPSSYEVVSMVKEVVIRGDAQSPHIRTGKVSPSDVEVVRRRIPNIRYLKFKHLYLCSYPYESAQDQDYDIPGIPLRELSLHDVYFDLPGQPTELALCFEDVPSCSLVELLSLFTSVSRLHFHAVDSSALPYDDMYLASARTEGQKVSRRFRVEKLIWKRDKSFGLPDVSLEVLKHSPRGLRYMKDVDLDGDHSTVNLFLQAAGQTLKSLALHLKELSKRDSVRSYLPH